jgi:hypothetical protein
MGLLLAETPPFKFFQDAQGWNSLDTAEITVI